MKKIQLNKEQEAAVAHQDGPLLIVAGAGTGKTALITARIANIIEKDWARSDEILALTFTEKAAGEMEERVDRILPLGYFDLTISTFHSFCHDILKESGLDIGLPTDFKLLDEFEQYSLFKKNLERFDLDYYKPMGNPTKFIRDLLKHFSRCKDEDITPLEYLQHAEELRQNLDGMLSGCASPKSVAKAGGIGKKKGKKEVTNKPTPPSGHPSQEGNLEKSPPARGVASEGRRGVSCDAPAFFLNSEGEFDKEVAENEVKKIEEVANAYHVYQNLLLEKNSLDFGDLINYCLKLFRERPNILEKYRARFKYILVDEFQDTNWAQYELVKMLAAPKNNITVVGDDDQCLPGDSLVLTEAGKKRIDKIKVGDKVATAVGKGYLSYSQVKFVNKNKKKARLLTFKTISGRRITVTDNHKMFCHLPANWNHHKKNHKEKRFFYVYLMHKQELGWRLGITCDLAVRLKLERTADRIIAVRAFSGEEEARYHEALWSLKYGIPTVCFAERDGIMTMRKWSEKLYKELSVEDSVAKMANDLNIDLSAHQFSLGGVVRGGKVRVKINLEMCARNYRSEYAKNYFLQSPQILHQLSVETSHLPTIKILEKAGFNFQKAKEGKRLRIAGSDLTQLGKTALKIKKLTGGIIENSAKIGKTNFKTQKSLIVSAKNILPGMFMPVLTERGIVYEQVAERLEKRGTLTVYDLEVEKTHNFVADNFLVHNSIYRFRGAAMANILEFKKDYPQAEQIFLVENYRNAQEILDLSYEFIKLNNPNRLEYQLAQPDHALNTPRPSATPLKRGISRKDTPKSSALAEASADTSDTPPKEGNSLSKKLKSNTKEKGIVEVIRGADTDDEIVRVVNKIADIKTKDKEATWGDFAILARANDHAKEVCAYLDEAGFPYKLNSSRGLYGKEEILNCLNYLTAAADYYDGAALYKALSLPVFELTIEDLTALNYVSYKKAMSLYKVLNEAAALGFDKTRLGRINKFLGVFGKHAAATRHDKVSEVLQSFLEDSGYLKYLYAQPERKAIESTNLLNQFMKRIKQFETDSDDKSVRAFLQELNVEIEAGEQGTLPFDENAGPETIKIMTVHAAKGLEFKYVFVINMIDKRFPSTERSESISIPNALLDEVLPEGDHHLEEERRLFYVAATRAKKGLYLSWSSDAGGKRERRASRFLVETKLVEDLTLENAGEKAPSPLDNESPLSGGVPSVSEAGGVGGEVKNSPLERGGASGSERRGVLKFGDGTKSKEPEKFVPAAPERFSFSQLAAFEKCPYQYRFAHILRVPTRGKPSFSFGKTMHATLQKILQSVKQAGEKKQDSLFSCHPEARPAAAGQAEGSDSILRAENNDNSKKLVRVSLIGADSSPASPSLQQGGPEARNDKITLDECLKIYAESWEDDWYPSEKLKEEYRAKGKEIIKQFYEQNKDNWPKVLFLEKDFSLRFPVDGEGITIAGKIDRIDEMPDGKLKIVDYKTGNPKEKLEFDDKAQLLIYQMAIKQLFRQEVGALAFHYLDDNSQIEFLGAEKDFAKLDDKISATVRAIRLGEFPPKPGMCKYCDFNGICEFRKL